MTRLVLETFHNYFTVKIIYRMYSLSSSSSRTGGGGASAGDAFVEQGNSMPVSTLAFMLYTVALEHLIALNMPPHTIRLTIRRFISKLKLNYPVRIIRYELQCILIIFEVCASPLSFPRLSWPAVPYFFFTFSPFLYLSLFPYPCPSRHHYPCNNLYHPILTLGLAWRHLQ